MKLDQRHRLWGFAALSLLGSIILALLTVLCFRLDVVPPDSELIEALRELAVCTNMPGR
jgi:hypothetical protein